MSAPDVPYGFEPEEQIPKDQAAEVERDLLQSAFLTTLGNDSPAANRVLKYLAGYCRQVSGTFVAGQPDTSAFYEGRRDVFLKILQFLEMDDRELLARARNEALKGREVM